MLQARVGERLSEQTVGDAGALVVAQQLHQHRGSDWIAFDGGC